MLYFEKSQPAPECLEEEKKKKSGDYKCGKVISRLKEDFKNKCYICELIPTSINVEHFRPHKKNKDLKFSWDNLFYSCVHCNNTKLAKYDDILDCTKLEDDIESKIKYILYPFPAESVKVEALDNENSTISTKNLIEAVFNGTTELKKIESANLRDCLLQDIEKFYKYISRYYHLTDQNDKKHFLTKIKSNLNKNSNFVSFKRWIIRENEILLKEFGKYIN